MVPNMCIGVRGTMDVATRVFFEAYRVALLSLVRWIPLAAFAASLFYNTFHVPGVYRAILVATWS